MPDPVSVYEAKTQLSSLIDRAAAGEEIVITKNGIPRAKIVPLPFEGRVRVPAGVLRVSHISEDFDAQDPAIEALFDGG